MWLGSPHVGTRILLPGYQRLESTPHYNARSDPLSVFVLTVLPNHRPSTKARKASAGVTKVAAVALSVGGMGFMFFATVSNVKAVLAIGKDE